jgi:hypothetical protein
MRGQPGGVPIRRPGLQMEIEGEAYFPIQVHSDEYYFYCGVCYFYWRLRPLFSMGCASLLKNYIKQNDVDFSAFSESAW